MNCSALDLLRADLEEVQAKQWQAIVAPMIAASRLMKPMP